MATKVLDVELQRLPQALTGLEGYRKALVLFRLNGRPIGQVSIPVLGGTIDGDELRRRLLEAGGYPLWECWIHQLLGVDETPPSKPGARRATIAVCTRDRPDDLARCLDALMTLPDDGQEILVVDNSPSSDTTQRLVARYPRMRYVLEERPGLNVARNRALREACHEIVAFIDDDAVADPGWLRALVRNFYNPLVLCVTGLTMPLELETRAQELFETVTGFSRRGFKRRVFDMTTHNRLAAGVVGAGANMALRRNVTREVGWFDEALDAGTPTRSGGDHELFARIMAAGYRIVYDPQAVNWHRHRRTMQELQQTMYGYGVGAYAAMTRSLVCEKEFGMLGIAWGWFWHEQARNVLKALLRRRGRVPLRLLWAELRGCLVGPWAYFRSRRQLRRRAVS